MDIPPYGLRHTSEPPVKHQSHYEVTIPSFHLHNIRDRQYLDALVKMKTIVVGAGPVGALAAIYAAQRGHQVEVYELREGKFCCSLSAYILAYPLFSTGSYFRLVQLSLSVKRLLQFIRDFLDFDTMIGHRVSLVS
jgi:hypothetical protein